MCVSGVIAGFEFSRQQLSNRGIVELLTGSEDDRFELVEINSGRGIGLPRAGFAGQGEDLQRTLPRFAYGRHCSRATHGTKTMMTTSTTRLTPGPTCRGVLHPSWPVNSHPEENDE